MDIIDIAVDTFTHQREIDYFERMDHVDEQHNKT
jgi:hypothetical protein